MPTRFGRAMIEMTVNELTGRPNGCALALLITSRRDKPMPRKKQRRPLHKPLPRPNVDAAKRASWEASANVDVRVSTNPARTATATESWYLHSPAEFESLMAQLQDKARVVGYLRIVPEIDGLGSHWMIKFTRGAWNGHYLYFFQRGSDPARMACVFLLRQYEEVCAGSRKPARDNAWGS